MSRFALVALLALLAGAAHAQPTSRHFLVPTARPIDKPLEIGARFFVPSVEARLGDRVSVGLTGIAFRFDGDPAGGAAADLRVTAVDRENLAVAVGATAMTSFAEPEPLGIPGSVYVYAATTYGNEKASATVGLGARVHGYAAAVPPDGWEPCSVCESPDPVNWERQYRVRASTVPVVFGGAEAEFARSGAFGYRAAAEVLALPGVADDYSVLSAGGLRITRKTARLDLGAAVGSYPYGPSDRTTEIGPWIGFTAGL